MKHRQVEREECGFPIFDGWPSAGHCILDVGHEGACMPALSRAATAALYDHFYAEFAAAFKSRALCTLTPWPWRKHRKAKRRRPTYRQIVSASFRAFSRGLNDAWKHRPMTKG